MNDIFTIQRIEPKPHQRGGATYPAQGPTYRLPADAGEWRYGPVIELVKNGKPLNPRGAALIKRLERKCIQ